MDPGSCRSDPGVTAVGQFLGRMMETYEKARFIETSPVIIDGVDVFDFDASLRIERLTSFYPRTH